MKEITEYIKSWSNKLSISENEIQKDYDELLSDENTIHPDLNDEDRKLRALQRLALIYKKQLRSPAVGFEGIIIGVGDSIDIVARIRREAKELFKTDPQQAIKIGVTDEDGVPLDSRKEWSTGRQNIGYGKPLPEHNWLRNVFGIAVKTKIPNDTPKFFTISLSGDKATNDNPDFLPLFKPMRFAAIDRTPSESIEKMYVLNPSVFTNFKVDSELKLPEFESLVKNTCKDIFSDMKNLDAYHDQTKDIINRVVITEGSVSSLNLEPTTFGSRIMVIEDETASLEDLDAKGVTCWVPLRANIDFAEGSKVLVVGRTAQGKKKDDVGNPTEELGDVSINVYGIYALPEFKINLPEEIEDITEEDVIEEGESEKQSV